jgi:hypothetical protein
MHKEEREDFQGRWSRTNSVNRFSTHDFGMNGENVNNKSTWSVNSSIMEGK